MVVLHTSLKVLWAIWEIPALPPQKEMFYIVGSVEGAHGGRLTTQKHTALVTLACKPSWTWGKINEGGTRICIYSSNAKKCGYRIHWERPEPFQLSKRSWYSNAEAWATELGKSWQTVHCTCPLEENILVIRDAEKLKNSESTVGSLPEGFKELICFGCVDCLIYNI